MEKNISEETLKRLNDPKLEKAWEYVEKKFGIKPENLSDLQKTFLVNGASTTLVPTNIKDKEGKEVKVSLRFAISEDESHLQTEFLLLFQKRLRQRRTVLRRTVRLMRRLLDSRYLELRAGFLLLHRGHLRTFLQLTSQDRIQSLWLLRITLTPE